MTLFEAGAESSPPDPRPAAVPAGVPGLQGSRTDLRSGVLLALVLGLAGLVTGGLWVWLAPRADFRVTDTQGSVEVVGGGLVSPELFMSDDGVYVLLLAGLGLVAGLAAWALRSRRGVVTLTATAVGMLLASLVTWQLGALLGRGPSQEQLSTPGTQVTTALDLGALAALAVGPFVAVFVYLVATVLTSRDDLGRADTTVGPHQELSAP